MLPFGSHQDPNADPSKSKISLSVSLALVWKLSHKVEGIAHWVVLFTFLFLTRAVAASNPMGWETCLISLLMKVWEACTEVTRWRHFALRCSMLCTFRCMRASKVSFAKIYSLRKAALVCMLYRLLSAESLAIASLIRFGWCGHGCKRRLFDRCLNRTTGVNTHWICSRQCD